MDIKIRDLLVAEYTANSQNNDSNKTIISEKEYKETKHPLLKLIYKFFLQIKLTGGKQ